MKEEFVVWAVRQILRIFDIGSNDSSAQFIEIISHF